MNLELLLIRRPHIRAMLRTPGDLYANGLFYCHTCEDPVREIVGRPVEEWKIRGETAIPSGRYALALKNSPRFGENTLTILNVPGFDFIRMHAGNDAEHTEGCPLLGYELTAEGSIAFGQTRAAVKNLQRAVREVLARDGKAFIEIRNPA